MKRWATARRLRHPSCAAAAAASGGGAGLFRSAATSAADNLSNNNKRESFDKKRTTTRSSTTNMRMMTVDAVIRSSDGGRRLFSTSTPSLAMKTGGGSGGDEEVDDFFFNDDTLDDGFSSPMHQSGVGAGGVADDGDEGELGELRRQIEAAEARQRQQDQVEAQRLALERQQQTTVRDAILTEAVGALGGQIADGSGKHRRSSSAAHQHHLSGAGGAGDAANQSTPTGTSAADMLAMLQHLQQDGSSSSGAGGGVGGAGGALLTPLERRRRLKERIRASPAIAAMRSNILSSEVYGPTEEAAVMDAVDAMLQREWDRLDKQETEENAADGKSGKRTAKSLNKVENAGEEEVAAEEFGEEDEADFEFAPISSSSTATNKAAAAATSAIVDLGNTLLLEEFVHIDPAPGTTEILAMLDSAKNATEVSSIAQKHIVQHPLWGDVLNGHGTRVAFIGKLTEIVTKTLCVDAWLCVAQHARRLGFRCTRLHTNEVLTAIRVDMSAMFASRGRDPYLVLQSVDRLRALFYMSREDGIVWEGVFFARIFLLCTVLATFMDRQNFYRATFPPDFHRRDGVVSDWVLTHVRAVDFDETVRLLDQFLQQEIIPNHLERLRVRPSFTTAFRLLDYFFATDNLSQTIATIQECERLGLTIAESSMAKMMQLACFFNHPRTLELFERYRVLWPEVSIASPDISRLLSFYSRSGGGLPCPECGEPYNHRNVELAVWETTPEAQKSCRLLRMARQQRGELEELVGGALREVPMALIQLPSVAAVGGGASSTSSSSFFRISAKGMHNNNSPSSSTQNTSSAAFHDPLSEFVDLPQCRDWSQIALSLYQYSEQRAILWGTVEWRLFLQCCSFLREPADLEVTLRHDAQLAKALAAQASHADPDAALRRHDAATTTTTTISSLDSVSSSSSLNNKKKTQEQAVVQPQQRQQQPPLFCGPGQHARKHNASATTATTTDSSNTTDTTNDHDSVDSPSSSSVVTIVVPSEDDTRRFAALDDAALLQCARASRVVDDALLGRIGYEKTVLSTAAEYRQLQGATTVDIPSTVRLVGTTNTNNTAASASTELASKSTSSSATTTTASSTTSSSTSPNTSTITAKRAVWSALTRADKFNIVLAIITKGIQRDTHMDDMLQRVLLKFLRLHQPLLAYRVALDWFTNGVGSGRVRNGGEISPITSEEIMIAAFSISSSAGGGGGLTGTADLPAVNYAEERAEAAHFIAARVSTQDLFVTAFAKRRARRALFVQRLLIRTPRADIPADKIRHMQEAQDRAVRMARGGGGGGGGGNRALTVDNHEELAFLVLPPVDQSQFADSQHPVEKNYLYQISPAAVQPHTSPLMLSPEEATHNAHMLRRFVYLMRKSPRDQRAKTNFKDSGSDLSPGFHKRNWYNAN